MANIKPGVYKGTNVASKAKTAMKAILRKKASEMAKLSDDKYSQAQHDIRQLRIQRS